MTLVTKKIPGQRAIVPNISDICSLTPVFNKLVLLLAFDGYKRDRIAPV